MSNATPRLVFLSISPWSERARWALDHHGIDYELVAHVPLLMQEFEVAIREELEIEATPPPAPAAVNDSPPTRRRSLIRKA